VVLAAGELVELRGPFGERLPDRLGDQRLLGREPLVEAAVRESGLRHDVGHAHLLYAALAE
jgi:hypothetical protein